MYFNRKKFRYILILLFFSLANCTKSLDAPLRVATIPWPGYETIHLALSLNYINPNQIRLIEQTNQTQTFQSLRSGTVDAAMTTLDMAFSLLDEKLDIQVVLVMNISSGADAIVARPEFLSLKDLKGKRVGFETVAVGAVMLDAMLTAGNFNVADVQLVSVSANEHINAYRDKKVDAIVTFEPNLSKLKKLGARVIFDSTSIPNRIVDVLVIRKEILNDSNKIKNLKSLIESHFKALEYFKSNPEDSAIKLAPYLNVKPEEVQAQFTGIILPNLEENYSLLSGQTPKLLSTSKELAELMVNHKLLQSSVNLDNVIESKYLPQKQK